MTKGSKKHKDSARILIFKKILWYPMGIQRVPSEYHRKNHSAGNLENRSPANISFSKMPHEALQHTIKIHEKIKSEVFTDHWLPSFSESSKVCYG